MKEEKVPLCCTGTFLRDKVWNMAACFSAKDVKVKEGDKIIQP